MLILTSLVAMSGGAGIFFGVRLLFLLDRFTRESLPDLPAEADTLPTVSVCIPARNETHAMTQCLERLVASTYPKLEIIVLDDSSVDNTSILIKSFAHAGVRFVEGAPLPDGWLGKTHAQHELFREASGDYIIYLDVDTQLMPHSIDALVALALSEKAIMVSVLPTREDAWRASVLFATLKHFWSICSHTARRPAASTNAWLIKKDFLRDECGGFSTLRTTAAPEHILAARAGTHNAYRFLVSTPALGISYEKKWRSQCQTSIRLLYPSLGGNPVLATLGCAALLWLLLPFAVFATALVTSWYLVHTVALVASLLLISVYMLYTTRVWKSGWVIGGLLFPIILLQELVLLLRSMYGYATKTVTWKGRPITQSAQDAAQR